MQFARIEFVKVLVAGQHVTHLPHAVFAFAREQHPQILHGRPHAAVVKVDKVRAIVRPQHVARMAIAVQSQLFHRARTVETVTHAIESLLHHAAISRIDVGGDKPVGQQKIARFGAKGFHVE